MGYKPIACLIYIQIMNIIEDSKRQSMQTNCLNKIFGRASRYAVTILVRGEYASG